MEKCKFCVIWKSRPTFDKGPPLCLKSVREKPSADKAFGRLRTTTFSANMVPINEWVFFCSVPDKPDSCKDAEE